jgi:hypothetical protein
MPNTLMKQWVEMGQASLNAFKQMSESDPAGVTTAVQQQLSTSDLALMLKGLLDATKQVGDLTTGAFTTLFYNQLKLLNLAGSAAALNDLSTTNTSFVNSFVQQQTALVNDFTGMFTTYLADLQKTRDLNDVALLQGDFFNRLEQKWKDSSNELGQLLLSAKTASTAWTERALDQAIAQAPEK